MAKFTENTPALEPQFRASLGEGNTPLIPSQRIGRWLGIDRLYFKLETVNPTGSYKDRFASVAASLMRQSGKKKMLATSSGNTGSALAAYAARFELDLELYVLENTPQDKLYQALAFGAKILRVKQFGLSSRVDETVFSRLQRRAQNGEATLLISAHCYCPREMAGVEGIGYEICEQLKGIPDHIFIPVGGGGLFLSCYQAFKNVASARPTQRIPNLHAVQPEGCATIVGPISRGEKQPEAVDCTSGISGLQVSTVLDGQQVLDGVLRSDGSGQMVSDAEVYAAQIRLIREEGIYSEPAGAAALAGLVKAREVGLIQPDCSVVCLVTGSGFKDRESIMRMINTNSLPLIEAGDI